MGGGGAEAPRCLTTKPCASTCLLSCPAISRWATSYPSGLVANLVDRFHQIIGINCSQPDLGYLAAVIDALGDRTDVHVGGPHQTLTAISPGAKRFVTSEANLAPRLCMSVLNHFESGDAARMTAAFG